MQGRKMQSIIVLSMEATRAVARGVLTKTTDQSKLVRKEGRTSQDSYKKCF